MLLEINAEHPEPRKIQRAVEVMRRGEVIAYPTDTVFGLGCDIREKRAVERIYRMKGMDKSQLLSFICADLSDIARYAYVSDYAYRIMRRCLPGPYTFVLQATREVPKVLRQQRKTVGIRIPDSPVAVALARELGSPVASTSASIDGEVLLDPREIDERFSDVELVLDTGHSGLEPSTVVDLSGDEPEVLREGAGPVDFL
ncbi:MAG: L-threonylcarbamoyladenylate synthase [Myxococcales bacterium]|jgi:tRNA threonylcarbamoyl adenosine modification protein (Sua5/YciO/YrdC/YwlC family)